MTCCSTELTWSGSSGRRAVGIGEPPEQDVEALPVPALAAHRAGGGGEVAQREDHLGGRDERAARRQDEGEEAHG